MKHILILADGLSAEHFIKRINQKRVADNHYVVVTPNMEFAIPQKSIVDMDIHTFDPTSYSKLRSLFHTASFSMVFVVLDSVEDTRESLKNIRMLDEKIRVHLLDDWNSFDESDESYTQVFNIHQLIANRLFDHLPDVPLVAQNVGMAEGEIMEIAIPFGSSFAYRHIGSISQVKWRIVALYRHSKLILPTAATMIKPQDTIIVIGKSSILNNIYLRIKNKNGLFPEPFGKQLYLIVDMEHDADYSLSYISEAIYMLDRLEDKHLIVRIINPGDFELLDKIKSLSSRSVEILIEYANINTQEVIVSDMQNFNIGLIFVGMDTFTRGNLSALLYDLKKLVYVYGDTPLCNITKSTVLMGDDKEMESISSTSFYISQTLDLDLCLCNFDPEGDFESKKTVVEHYETLSHATNYPINIEEKKANPARELDLMSDILQIVPLTYDLESASWLRIFSTVTKKHLLGNDKHPKLLVPAILDD